MAISAARALVSILTRLEYSCALCGDVACHFLGQPQVLTKVEAIIFAPISRGPWLSINVVKTAISETSNHPSPFLISRDSTGDSVTLSYHNPAIHSDLSSACVIELENLDSAAVHVVQDIRGLPFVPTSYLLLLKLEDWEFSLTASSDGVHQMAVKVIQGLLKSIASKEKWNEEPLDDKLHAASHTRAQRYVAKYPEYSAIWTSLSFGEEKLVGPSSSASDLMEPATGADTREEELGQEPPRETFTLTNPSRIQMVVLAAKTVVDLLRKCGWVSTIFGGLGCFLYGNTRAPNDVDVLVLPPSGSRVTTEELKLNLVNLDPYHFYTTCASNP
ncbi:hypothetical protein FPV67DRAFT_1669929 [Lyophyllum atratum]|nr:hypothetical protein FPV67DRAFT_1669929 [Lyophyllum atratum]